ncbi:MAG: hypothetical protein PHE17_15065 [Thiothrix sp.]|uniref:hypothetical protein n=1 Tax=Thiothrix sp. TaxID=1032 RepID=UPI00262A70A8|nr:hypothetical protein [Thiothrix sp.]MDD5394333.1 hypothetical protein [Thiothrix sp.]
MTQATDDASLLESLGRLCSSLESAAGIAAEAHFAKENGSNDLARTRLNAIKTSLQDLPADIERLLSAMPTDMNTYTDLGGSSRTAGKMVWRENGRYWKPSDPADDAAGEWLPCSLYSVGTDEDGDDITVWLDGNRQEVKA